MITAAAVAEAQRKKEVELVEAQREAQKQAIAITVAAEAEKDAAQNHALAVTTRAAANLRNYEAEAEGQKRLNEARSTLSSALIDFDLAKERLRTIPQALSETVRPLEKIGEVKIIDLCGRAGGGNGIASGPAGGPVDGLLGSLWRTAPTPRCSTDCLPKRIRRRIQPAAGAGLGDAFIGVARGITGTRKARPAASGDPCGVARMDRGAGRWP